MDLWPRISNLQKIENSFSPVKLFEINKDLKGFLDNLQI